MRLWKKRSGDGGQGGWRVTKELREEEKIFLSFFISFLVSAAADCRFWSMSFGVFLAICSRGWTHRVIAE